MTLTQPPPPQCGCHKWKPLTTYALWPTPHPPQCDVLNGWSLMKIHFSPEVSVLFVGVGIKYRIRQYKRGWRFAIGTRGSWKMIFGQMWDEMGIFLYPKGRSLPLSETWGTSTETRKFEAHFAGERRGGQPRKKTIQLTGEMKYV